jgi:hypothetical protein
MWASASSKNVRGRHGVGRCTVGKCLSPGVTLVHCTSFCSFGTIAIIERGVVARNADIRCGSTGGSGGVRWVTDAVLADDDCTVVELGCENDGLVRVDDGADLRYQSARGGVNLPTTRSDVILCCDRVYASVKGIHIL